MQSKVTARRGYIILLVSLIISINVVIFTFIAMSQALHSTRMAYQESIQALKEDVNVLSESVDSLSTRNTSVVIAKQPEEVKVYKSPTLIKPVQATDKDNINGKDASEPAAIDTPVRHYVPVPQLIVDKVEPMKKVQVNASYRVPRFYEADSIAHKKWATDFPTGDGVPVKGQLNTWDKSIPKVLDPIGGPVPK